MSELELLDGKEVKGTSTFPMFGAGFTSCLVIKMNDKHKKD